MRFNNNLWFWVQTQNILCRLPVLETFGRGNPQRPTNQFNTIRQFLLRVFVDFCCGCCCCCCWIMQYTCIRLLLFVYAIRTRLYSPGTIPVLVRVGCLMNNSKIKQKLEIQNDFSFVFAKNSSVGIEMTKSNSWNCLSVTADADPRRLHTTFFQLIYLIERLVGFAGVRIPTQEFRKDSD